MLAGALALLLLAADAEPVDAIVVCPAQFVPALDPLLAHRHAQGHRFLYVPNMWSPEEIRGAIRNTAKEGHLKSVLLVGDAEPAAAADKRVRARCVPAHRVAAKVNVKFGSEAEIGTDNWYADLDDDDLPDLAIGRLPADTPQELARIVRKILAYETALDHGAWRQRINFVAGVGGFGALTDSIIETSTKKLLTDGIPPTYQTSMTFGSWRSPFCPDPRQFHDTAVARHNEGCLFWVYIGHGQPTCLDRVCVPGNQFHIFDCDDCAKLKAERAPPVAIMLACYTAAYDRGEDCLAEEMLRTTGGPVAVYGGSRVTMPYAMAVMGSEMLGEYFENRPTTLGEVIKNAKRRMALPPDETRGLKNANRLLLDGIASVISPARDMLADERHEHLHLFNLIGDPLLTLSYPQEIKVETAPKAVPGTTLHVKVESPVSGRMVLELVCRRDVQKVSLPSRDRFDPSSASLSRLQETYQQANDCVWCRQEVDLRGRSAAEPGQAIIVQGVLAVPSEARGAAHVRVFVEGAKDYAVGAANLYIRPPEGNRPSAP
ncbi:MAG TPA: C25 family cysteine peptidase [Pirellulaceae bacterium]|nr:C25 family cysteine peptidase [Pirellulaceae bacterium]